MQQVEETFKLLWRLCSCVEPHVQVVQTEFPDISVVGDARHINADAVEDQISAMVILRAAMDRACRVYDIQLPTY